MSTFQMFPIRIFDLQEQGQSHEVQHRIIRHWIAICMIYNWVKLGWSISNHFCVIRQRVRHTDKYADRHILTDGHTNTNTLTMAKGVIFKVLYFA